MTWECIPNFWCHRRKWSRGCHEGFASRNKYWQGWRRSEWLQRCILWNKYSEVGGLLKKCNTLWVMARYLEIYSVSNGKPLQLKQNRRDMIEARLLGHNACTGIYGMFPFLWKLRGPAEAPSKWWSTGLYVHILLIPFLRGLIITLQQCPTLHSMFVKREQPSNIVLEKLNSCIPNWI